MSGDFVHLHLHTQYSLLDGANRVKDLIQKVKSSGMDAVAVTDHGNMFGAYDLQTTALEAGIKPILGVEAYIAPGSRFDRENVKTFDGEGNNYHLTLLVETPDGYKNLARLVSEAFLSGFYYKPRMDFELLEKHHDGIIALSGCLNGEVPKRLRAGDYDGAKKVALKYQTLFGKDRYFIEIMDHGLPDQRQIPPDAALSQDRSRPSHERLALREARGRGGPGHAALYRHRQDAHGRQAHEVRQLGVLREERRGDERRLPARHARGRAEHGGHRRPDHAERHHRHGPQDPDVSRSRSGAEPGRVPRGSREGGAGEAPRAPGALPGGIQASEDAGRVRRAAGVGAVRHPEACALELPPHRWDFIKYAKDEASRGSRPCSAAGCRRVVLGITDVDPLRYDLLFERFEPDRISMPDIDVDLRGAAAKSSTTRRKYGRENVGQIITFNPMKARAVIRDAASSTFRSPR